MRAFLFAAALVFGTGCAATSDSSASRGSASPRATLGASTSVPSKELGEAMALTFNVRWEGRVIDELKADGPAAQAGLREGDVLLSMDGITLFSSDDIADILRVATPGKDVPVTLKRAGSTEVTEAKLKLGSESVPSASKPQLDWQFASLAQLPRALEVARAEKKKVMVGLSGAET